MPLLPYPVSVNFLAGDGWVDTDGNVYPGDPSDYTYEYVQWTGPQGNIPITRQASIYDAPQNAVNGRHPITGELAADPRYVWDFEGHRFYYNHETGALQYPPDLTAHEIHLLLDKYSNEAGAGIPAPFDPEDPNQYCAFHDCGGGYLFGFLPVGTLNALVPVLSKDSAFPYIAAVALPFALAPTIPIALVGIAGGIAGREAGQAVGQELGGDTGALVGGIVGGIGGGYGGAMAGTTYFPAEAAAPAGMGDLGTLDGSSGDTLLIGEASRDTLSGDLGTEIPLGDTVEAVAEASGTSVDPVYFGFDQALAPGASGFEPYTIASDLVAGSPAPAFLPQLDFSPLQAGDLMHYTKPTASDWVPSLGDVGKALAVGKAALALALAQSFDGAGGRPVRSVPNAKPVAFRASENPGSLGGWYDSGPVSADPIASAGALPGSDSGGAALLIPAMLGGLLYYTLSAR